MIDGKNIENKYGDRVGKIGWKWLIIEATL